MIAIGLDPVDTLFFRDGTPFTAGSSPQEGVAGLFPPYPTTVTGALRAALARCNGWDGRGRWPERLDPVLGDGPNDLGTLAIEGPFVLRGDQPLFPVPRHLLGSSDTDGWHPRLLLRPGPAATCDMGDDMRLPQAPEGVEDIEKCKADDGQWLTLAGMESVLRGELPAQDQVVSSQDLWKKELRIGLERNSRSRTAEEGQLYSTRHVRLAHDVSLGVRITGVPKEWQPFLKERLIPLGGESRLVACREWNAGPLSILSPGEADASGRRLTVVALTPLDLDPAVYYGQRPFDVPGDARVVSACLNRPQRVGGWDSLARRPLPLRSVLPPGSVLFCEVDEPRRFVEAITHNAMPRLGTRQAWGFGLVALGVWPD